MKIQRIYTDTSVIGGVFDKEFATWSNGLFEDLKSDNFKLVVSEVVSAEIENAPEYVKNFYKKLLTLEVEIVKITNEATKLANTYQSQQILTEKFYDDGLHIALATIAEVDVLVSWNFKHIVNFNKIRLFNSVNLALGYKQIQIYSPREVTTYEQG